MAFGTQLLTVSLIILHANLVQSSILTYASNPFAWPVSRYAYDEAKDHEYEGSHMPINAKAVATRTNFGITEQAPRLTTRFQKFDDTYQAGEPTSQNSLPYKWMMAEGSDWMADVNYYTRLNRLTIPGTHDSGAVHGGVGCETQSMSIYNQLRTGIRAFDIRCRRNRQGFDIYHGICNQYLSFGDVLNTMTNYLDNHDKEVILMNVQEEGTAAPFSSSFGTIWNSYMSTYSRYMEGDLRTNIPYIGSVRGKIIVLRNNHQIGSYGWNWDSTVFEWDSIWKVYNTLHDSPFGSDTVSLSQKKRRIDYYFGRAQSSSKMVSVSLTGSTGMTPIDVATSCNQHAYDFIGVNPSKKSLGIVWADFPGDPLIYRLLSTNFS